MATGSVITGLIRDTRAVKTQNTLDKEFTKHTGWNACHIWDGAKSYFCWLCTATSQRKLCPSLVPLSPQGNRLGQAVLDRLTTKPLECLQH